MPDLNHDKNLKLEKLNTELNFQQNQPSRVDLICNVIKIALWHWCSVVHSLHIFRTPFSKNTSG